MPLVSVKYSGEIKKTVDNYNTLDEEEQSGSYWDKTDEEIKKVKKHIKDHYKTAQDYTCIYCKQKIVVEHGMAWDVEHIIPKSDYPKFLFTEQNLALACKDCNLNKKDKNVLTNPKRKTFPTKCEDYIIVHPHFDEYYQHIKIIESSQIFIPKSHKGRQTIEVCGLLRFAYQFANYNNIGLETEKLIQRLTDELINSSSSDKYAILGLIADIAKDGQRIARETFLKNLN
ncbi:MAG TPA: HNH endonuclease [Arcobacter sp.]|nr:HNH endonuclease [Arcobacter sp.]